VHIHAIRLHVAAASVDLDARRVDDAVLDALCEQEAVQPEPLAPRLVAAHDRRARRQAESPSCASDFRPQRLPIASRNRPLAWLLTEAGCERELPGRFAELERKEQAPSRFVTLDAAGRCCHRRAPLVCDDFKGA
jgi:hypothetical protein